MQEPVHHEGEPFVRPRRPAPVVVGVFLLIAALGMVGAGVVAVLVWKALTDEITQAEDQVSSRKHPEATKNAVDDANKTAGKDDRVDHAKRDIKALDLAIATFLTRHGMYPTTLPELAEPQPDGSPPILAEKTFLDPWGNPYVYELASRQPMTERPLVYSHGPPGQNKRISNWDFEPSRRNDGTSTHK
jgi:hypothetical protein